MLESRGIYVLDF